MFNWNDCICCCHLKYARCQFHSFKIIVFFLSTYAHMPPNIHHCADVLTKTIKTHLRHTCPVQEISFCLSVYLTVFQKCWLWRMRCLSNDLVEICIWPTIQTKAIKHRHACKMILITNVDSLCCCLAAYFDWRTMASKIIDCFCKVLLWIVKYLPDMAAGGP